MTFRKLALIPLASIGLLGLALAGCGDDDGGNRDAIIDAMVSEGATRDEAECFVNELGDDAERLFSASEEDLSEDDLKAFFDALLECGAFEE